MISFEDIKKYIKNEYGNNKTKIDEKGKIDKGALAIIHAVEKEGFEAYAVGGSVRDLLLGKVPHDWDITTSAHPEDIVLIAQKNKWKAVDNQGIRFGTVILILDGNSYEVTSFRSEFYGNDSHKPEEIRFAKTLKEDLSRRDFTINAMAVDGTGTIYDYFNGVHDLEHKILKTVGSAEERFKEDALRPFRACRFLGQLDFMADMEIVKAIPLSSERVKGLSLERIKAELESLLLSDHPARGLDLLVRSGLNECSCRIKKNGKEEYVPILPELSHLVNLPQEKQFHKYDGWYHTLAVVDASPKERVIRWAALFHDIGKGMPGVRAVRNGRYTDYGHDVKGAEITLQVLTRLKMSRPFISRVVWLVKNHMHFHFMANTEEADGKKWIRQLARSGTFKSSEEIKEGIRQLTELCKADIIGCGRPFSATDGHQAFGEYMMDLSEDMPVSTKELMYDHRLVEVLGDDIGAGMKNLLLRVQNGNLTNDAETLLDAGIRYRRRHNEGD